MNLRVLKEGVTLRCKYEDGVRAYDRESSFKRARLGPTFIFGTHPTDVFPLNTYEGIPVNAEGMLMTSNTGLRYLIQKFWYRNRNIVNGEDMATLERSGIYYKPM